MPLTGRQRRRAALPSTDAWFQVAPGAKTLSIATGVDAVWRTVTIARAVTSFEVRVRGPDGLPPMTVGSGRQRGVLQVLSVAGTRAIEIVVDGEVHSYDPADGDILLQ